MMNDKIRKMNENDTINFIVTELLAPVIDKIAEEKKVYLLTPETATEILNDSMTVLDTIEKICAKCEDYAMNEYVEKFAREQLQSVKAPKFKYRQIMLPYYAYGYACDYFWEMAVGEYISEVFFK